ncbi:MAG: class I SAM-dependent methyltransferase [Rivularia sp. (in: cyanobacteria)]
MLAENVFSDVEFDNWAYIEKLKPEEKFLIDKYINKNSRIIEAGTGGGRILIELQKLGFSSLQGYDCEPKMIEVANQRDTSGEIKFEVQDAVNLPYENESFEQALYLQQIMSFIPTEEQRLKAFKEAHRILKPSGTILFAVLNFDARIRKSFYQKYLSYLMFFRKVTNSKNTIQTIPWLKHNDKPNLSALIDKSPYTYWFKIEEIYQILETVGFQVIALGSSPQIQQGKMYNSPQELLQQQLEGILYVVCKK